MKEAVLRYTTSEVPAYLSVAWIEQRKSSQISNGVRETKLTGPVVLTRVWSLNLAVPRTTISVMGERAMTEEEERTTFECVHSE